MTDKRTDIAYIISHGFAARMLLQTDLLGRLIRKGYKIAVITPAKNDQNLINYAKEHGIEMIEYNPSSSLWQGEYMRIRKYLFEDIKKNAALWEKHLRDLKMAGSFSRRFKIQLYYILYLILNNLPFLRKWLAGYEKKSLKDPAADELLAKLDPRLLIATYPMNLPESRLLYAGNKSDRVRTVIHLLSWDNITCKGYFPQLASRYISWGNIMTQEFMEFYKMPKEHIYNTGVPHFDLHKGTQGSLNYKEIIKAKGLNPEKPYIFFALGAPYFSPTEIDIAEWLAKKIERDEFGDMQLIIRPHPQNLSDNKADTILKERLKAMQSSRVVIDWPKMLKSSSLNWSMQMDDMLEFAYLLEGCRLSINSGSTVSIDSLLHDKPVIQPLFDAKPGLPWWQSVDRVWDYTHCKKLVDLGGVIATKNFEEFEFEIRRYLDNPAYSLARMQQARFEEVGVNDGNATERVVEAIETIINLH